MQKGIDLDDWHRRRDPKTGVLVSVRPAALEALRKTFLYTRRHVADAAGVTPAAIAHYERGGGVPRLEVARALVRLLGGAEAAACAIHIGEEVKS